MIVQEARAPPVSSNPLAERCNFELSVMAILVDTALLDLPLFAGLSAQELAGLSNRVTIEEHSRGTVLFRRGDAGEAL